MLRERTAMAPTAAGPRCAVPSSSMHSRDQRHPADLSWGAYVVQIQLTVRTFVCRNATYTRRIFTERPPDLLATYARKTHWLVTACRAIGRAVGGHAAEEPWGTDDDGADTSCSCMPWQLLACGADSI